MQAMSLRTRLLVAMGVMVVTAVGLAGWLSSTRLDAGARREVATQARARTAQARALYLQRAATLSAEAESISLYPAVITAISDGNAAPLLTWSGEVSRRQGVSVTVVDAGGRVIARGHAPNQAGDVLTGRAEGLQRALAGDRLSGTESGDELGVALRGYAPVLREGRVSGAVMIAQPWDDAFLATLAGDGARVFVADGSLVGNQECGTPRAGAVSCSFTVPAPSGRPAASLMVTSSLAAVDQARADARRRLWLVALGVLLAGGAGAAALATSLTRPLRRLTDAAGVIAAGDYSQGVAAAGRDEIATLARAMERMRVEIGRARAALQEERDTLNAVLGATDDGILMLDPSGMVAFANDRWSALLGGPDLGHAGELAIAAGESGTLAGAIDRWREHNSQIARADCERFEPYQRFRCYSAPVRRHDRYAGRIIVLHDVTRESEVERVRTALISTVSHELRSPLTAITGYIDALLDGGPWDGATTREFLQIIADSAEKLSGLVESLLDAAKLEAGVLGLEREPVRVERIAQQVVAQRRALFPSHHLAVVAGSRLPLADADPLRVEQIISNLVDNAIKYSPDGGAVTVLIGGEAEVEVSVRDEGIGIAAEHLSQLFERFYRVDSALSRTTKGAGLGLYICRSLVETHGGRIWVESTPGRGSVFRFTLPALTGERSEAGGGIVRPPVAVSN